MVGTSSSNPNEVVHWARMFHVSGKGLTYLSVCGANDLPGITTKYVNQAGAGFLGQNITCEKCKEVYMSILLSPGVFDNDNSALSPHKIAIQTLAYIRERELNEDVGGIGISEELKKTGMESNLEDAIIEVYRTAFSEKGWKAGITDLKTTSTLKDLESKDIKKVLVDFEKKGLATMDGEGIYYWLGPKTAERDKVKVRGRMDDVEGCKYLDHENVLPTLDLFYAMRVPCLIIGPHGTGKTDAVREFCRQKGLTLYNVPCSLGLREHHFVGRLNKESDGAIKLKMGPVPQSMLDENGGVLYLDELNAAEADVLLRMDEVLDGRRQITMEGQTLVANSKWWCVATINPLDHAGTKELPNQLMSRFAHRIHLGYPKEPTTELRLVYRCLGVKREDLPVNDATVHETIIQAIRQLRDPSMDLPYHPSLRESIASIKLLIEGVPLSMVTKHVLVAPYYQWGNAITSKVADFLMSKLGAENVGS